MSAMRPGKFAITACDRFIDVLRAFIDCGWQPVKLFSSPITEPMASNRQVIALAQQHKIPIQLNRMQERDLAGLQDDGCELLVVASYQWRVANWASYLPRAINFHPAPLPNYRGPYPLVQGILDRRSVWATTCHKLAAEFDTGDILASRYFDINANECHESLDLRTQIETRQLASTVAQDLDRLWDAASPQGVGNYIKMWTDADREIDFHCSVQEIDLKLRAFGNFECLARVNDLLYFVRRAVCWPVVHNCAPGVLAHVDGSHYVIACKDGCVALLDWSLVPAGTRIESASRQG